MAEQATEHFDVLIVGAGISGIGSAYHLTKQVPDKSYVVLDAQVDFGGTWTTHKYPGLRSDSDLYTFGYRFKPWTGAPIATAEKILTYLGEVIKDNGLSDHIRYSHTIQTAEWSSETNLWTLNALRTDTGETVHFTTNFLWMCQGYYRHSEGYTPDWADMDDFKGQIVHPQKWPTDLDYEGKNVIVIGSGATAATVVPAIVEKVAHVTMLQRSPTYFNPSKNINDLADTLREIQVDEDIIHDITRKKILFDQAMFTRTAAKDPESAKKMLLDGVRSYLGPDFDIEKHFVPHYRPWQQRVAFVPDGDLFKAIKSGKASVVTDHIEKFTETGIALKSGEALEADIIVTATGFNLCPMGDIEFTVDGKVRNWSDSLGYMGMMFTGLPNMIWVCGYFRASWTLRTELIADFVCDLLKHMDDKGVTSVTSALRAEDADMPILPWASKEDFNADYLMRNIDVMPKRGEKPEWQLSQDYWSEKDRFATIDYDDPAFVYR